MNTVGLFWIVFQVIFSDWDWWYWTELIDPQLPPPGSLKFQQFQQGPGAAEPHREALLSRLEPGRSVQSIHISAAGKVRCWRWMAVWADYSRAGPSPASSSWRSTLTAQWVHPRLCTSEKSHKLVYCSFFRFFICYFSFTVVLSGEFFLLGKLLAVLQLEGNATSLVGRCTD